ncbi:hypothetical protein DNK66_01760 [Klebsiella aerogenes]|nr:hypothetical protein DNK66_01760 [Klebsiella aerogenes]
MGQIMNLTSTVADNFAFVAASLLSYRHRQENPYQKGVRFEQ